MTPFLSGSRIHDSRLVNNRRPCTIVRRTGAGFLLGQYSTVPVMISSSRRVLSLSSPILAALLGVFYMFRLARLSLDNVKVNEQTRGCLCLLWEDIKIGLEPL